MNLRVSLVVLAMISLLSIGGVSLFIYTQLEQSAWNTAKNHTQASRQMFAEKLKYYLLRNQKVPVLLSRLPIFSEIQQQPTDEQITRITRVLTNSCNSIQASLCYLMNKEGLTIADNDNPSNTNLVGENYAFRPYFQQAIAGQPAMYLAMGVTSKKRGFYFSAPVKNSHDEITGVVVTKFPVELFEAELSNLDGIFTLVDPNGIVFASNQSQWLFRSFQDLSEETSQYIRQSRQFGEISAEPIGLTLLKEDLASTANERSYLITQQTVDVLTGWKIYFLLSTDEIKNRQYFTLLGIPMTGLFAVLFIMIGTVVIFFYFNAAREIKKRYRMEKELQRSERSYRLLFEKSEDPMWLIYNNAFMLANQAAVDAMGYSSIEELQNVHPGKLSPEFQPDGQTSFEKANRMMQTAYEKGYYRFEWTHVRKNGECFPVEVTLTRIPYQDKDSLYCVWRDISDRKEQEEKIQHQAHFDSLTNLPNRFLSLDRLSQLMKESQRSRFRIGVLFLDLDDFKKINDTLGHETGDELLKSVGERLNQCLRVDDTIGRLGGDEFIVLLNQLKHSEDARLIANNILQQFRQPFQVNQRDLMLSASIGIAIYPGDGEIASELLRNADAAMYHAKEQGGSSFSYFTAEMNQMVARRFQIEEQMHQGLQNGEFSIHYQAQVKLGGGQIDGFEALLRWNNPLLGEIPPSEFIPVAEQSGLIVPLGEYVLTEAIRTTRHWQDKHGIGFTIAVNLSPRQFRDPKLVTFIQRELESSGLDAGNLELEITEGVLLDGHAQTEQILRELSRLGVNLTMDDFGTGYSSLNYLRAFPFSVMKIDRLFVNDMIDNATDQELVNACINLAHGLNLKVVAEGIETEAQQQLLKEMQCDYGQGFLFGRPLGEVDMDEQLCAKLTKTS